MAKDATLTKTERNAAFKLVVEHGFDPLEFEWVEETKQETPFEDSIYRRSVLRHRPTEYCFKFGGHVYECSPGEVHKVDSGTRPDADWKRLRLVSNWLGRVRREYDAPDLWAMALEDRKFLQAASILEGSNTEFTSDERVYISERLDEIRDFARPRRILPTNNVNL